MYEEANEVVGDEVHEQFFFDHGGALAAQHVHTQCDLDIAQELSNYPNIPPDKGQFRPHLTIARVKRNRRQPRSRTEIDQSVNPGQISYAELKHQYKNKIFGSMVIQDVVLKQSTLTPSGPIYKTIRF